ncbi:uncharacterized protein LOC117575917 [Drosophila albomicans]|uniref:Uncharacterized protein LOC117575917 n=1 Tax=Drosophila albomicans TaxID=7291 RepID=A0A6P8ZEE5_DROAB|nr:uncharacterized protein LOC117575917 [Drosophila albomicans]
MDNSSSTSKRRSLTLSSRLLQKRHSASPQNRVRASATQDVTKDLARDVTDTPRSPNTLDIAENVECTPPHKKLHSLDDSLDFSPHAANLSPSCLFSQTLVTGSPEVSWRWNCDGRGDKVNTTSDSGFDSEEFGPNAPARRKQVRVDAALEYRRKQLDNKQRQAQQLRDQELLQQRYDKLHKHLEQQQFEEASPSPPIPVETASVTVADDPALADFLNDSDTDCFLLEATQQLESNLAPKQAATTPTRHNDSDYFLLEATQQLESKLATKQAATTPTSHHRKSPSKEKRASFYMKFLEDESESEDWFSALDEVMLEATQPKKPRISLQRYKSMPNNTAATNGGNANSSSNENGTNNKCPSSSLPPGKVETPGIKRHASSHALSPATSCVRGNLFGRRK